MRASASAASLFVSSFVSFLPSGCVFCARETGRGCRLRPAAAWDSNLQGIPFFSTGVELEISGDEGLGLRGFLKKFNMILYILFFI